MAISKNIILILLSLLLASSFSQNTLLTVNSQLLAPSAEQIMTTSLLTTSQLLIMSNPITSLCGSNQVQNTAHVCIKPEYIEGCQQYNSTSTCSKCSNGYTLNKDKKCSYLTSFTGTVTHIKGCIKQSSDVCDVCAQGFNKKLNKCVLGVRNCASYNADSECTQCEKDYSLILSQCRKNNILGCKYETDQHTCTECYAPFTLNGQHCDIDECRILNDYGCVACECGYYLATDRSCKSIAPGCLRYDKGFCINCLAHYKLKGGVCEIQGCLEYTGNYCKSCSDKYDLVQGECKFKNCIDWLNDQCLTCKEGFGVKSGICMSATTVSCS